MRMPLLALLHLAAKLVPRIQASNAGCVRLLPCDLQDVAEAVIVKPAHRVEVGGERFAVSLLQLLDKGLTLAAITSFAVCRCCGCLRFWVNGVTTAVVAVVFMGVSSLALAVAFHAMRGMYLHAERLLAKAGVARRKGRGISHPWRGSRRRNGKGGAQRRSAQAKRGRLGKPLAPRDRGRAP